MSNWNDISKLLGRAGSISLKKLELQTSASEIEHFHLTSVAKGVTEVARPPSSVSSAAPSTTSLPPPPFRAAPVVAEPEVVIVPSVATVKAPYAAKHTIDPIVLGIILFDPLYEGSPHATRHAIEKEVGIKLEGQLDELYKSNSGRSRGWTKVGLEAMIKPRCASGGDLKELDRARKPFLWAVVAEDKGMSAFLDFVCCALRIRCAVIDAEKRVAYLYPAADRVSIDAEEAKVTTDPLPLFAVDSNGHPLYNLRNGGELLAYLDKNGIRMQPPHSVVHSLSGLKLEELESVGKKLGMAAVEGNKSARISAIAEFKTRARLTT